MPDPGKMLRAVKKFNTDAGHKLKPFDDAVRGVQNTIFNPDTVVKAVDRPNVANVAGAVSEVGKLVPLTRGPAAVEAAANGVKGPINPARGLAIQQFQHIAQPALGTVIGKNDAQHTGGFSLDKTKARVKKLLGMVS